MPGTYAHITMVNLLKETRRLEKASLFPRAAIPIVLDWFKFCELGALSPDYPYLVLTDRTAGGWADRMHYERTGDIIKIMIRELRKLNGHQQEKGLAWLLGYASHVATDVTIHPVVELKVGPYEENQRKHRVCEMHQDALIFQRLNLGDVGVCEHLNSGIARCVNLSDDKIDKTILNLWQTGLQQAHTDHYQSTPPNIQHWHKAFQIMVGDIAGKGYKLFPLARHLGVKCGLTYPLNKEIDNQFTKNLKTPSGLMNYDDIFDLAIENVLKVWGWVGAGVLLGDDTFETEIGNWNLDTGRDQNNNLVFWGK